MADTFNAYHKWLGIPPKDQPPNHYRLLGVELFEADPDVISAAADQRMVYLRSFQSGKHGPAAEALLNEIAAARVCLLLPERREQYDRGLRARSSAVPAPRPLTPGAVQQEQALADQRTTARDTQPLRTIDTQEVPLPAVPLPTSTTAPPPRKSGPLPMSAPSKPPVKAIAVPPASMPAAPSSRGPSHEASAIEQPAASNLIADLPAYAAAALMFLVRLPGLLFFGLLRTADNALLRLAGEGNYILHNFLRVVAPIVLLIATVVAGYFGVRWATPRIVAAIRERAAEHERGAAAARALALRRKPPPAVADLPDPDLPPIVIPPPVIPVVVTPDPTPMLVQEPPAAPQALGLRTPPTYTADQLQVRIAEARLNETALDYVTDPAVDTDKFAGLIGCRQALRGLAHTATFAQDVSLEQRDAVGAIMARAHDTHAKRQYVARVALAELARAEPATGLVFSGIVRAKRFYSGLFETRIEIAGEPPQTVLVLSTANLAEAFVERSRVVVLGALVSNPTEEIVGYRGPSQPVVWGGRIVAAPALADVVASVPPDPPDDSPMGGVVEAEPLEEVVEEEPVDPARDLLALARFATALQNSGQSLTVPEDHPLLCRWIALGMVARVSKRSWGPEQAEGPPDTPDFGDRGTAWASASRDDRQEWLDLRYAQTIIPEQILVVETYCPGALVAITGFRGDREQDLWKGTDPTRPEQPGGTSVVKIETPFPTNRLRIYLDSPAVSGWNEIDAVGIIDNRKRTHWAMTATASTSYAGADPSPLMIDRDRLLQAFNRSPDLLRELLRDPTGQRAIGPPDEQGPRLK